MLKFDIVSILTGQHCTILSRCGYNIVPMLIQYYLDVDTTLSRCWWLGYYKIPTSYQCCFDVDTISFQCRHSVVSMSTQRRHNVDSSLAYNIVSMLYVCWDPRVWNVSALQTVNIRNKCISGISTAMSGQLPVTFDTRRVAPAAPSKPTTIQ